MTSSRCPPPPTYSRHTTTTRKVVQPPTKPRQHSSQINISTCGLSPSSNNKLLCSVRGGDTFRLTDDIISSSVYIQQQNKQHQHVIQHQSTNLLRSPLPTFAPPTPHCPPSCSSHSSFVPNIYSNNDSSHFPSIPNNNYQHVAFPCPSITSHPPSPQQLLSNSSQKHLHSSCYIPQQQQQQQQQRHHCTSGVQTNHLLRLRRSITPSPSRNVQSPFFPPICQQQQQSFHAKTAAVVLSRGELSTSAIPSLGVWSRVEHKVGGMFAGDDNAIMGRNYVGGGNGGCLSVGGNVGFVDVNAGCASTAGYCVHETKRSNFDQTNAVDMIDCVVGDKRDVGMSAALCCNDDIADGGTLGGSLFCCGVKEL
eukprot:GHVS01019766.1.p1 GENE.GHVS01019766.1~~GHVS01019766.1.p1  ORF type:complete len:421 (-),score=145.06 GHVS01019766.1:6-1100(-)